MREGRGGAERDKRSEALREEALRHCVGSESEQRKSCERELLSLTLGILNAKGKVAGGVLHLLHSCRPPKLVGRHSKHLAIVCAEELDCRVLALGHDLHLHHCHLLCPVRGPGRRVRERWEQ